MNYRVYHSILIFFYLFIFAFFWRCFVINDLTATILSGITVQCDWYRWGELFLDIKPFKKFFTLTLVAVPNTLFIFRFHTTINLNKILIFPCKKFKNLNQCISQEARPSYNRYCNDAFLIWTLQPSTGCFLHYY